MRQKTVSQLDDAGYYLGETIAHESPLQPGVFLIPAGAIDRTPPTPAPGRRHRPWGAGWRAEDIPPPPPPPPPPQPQNRTAIIQGELGRIDQSSIRPARAVAAALAAGRPAPEPDTARLVALETEAQALRTELQALQK